MNGTMPTESEKFDAAELGAMMREMRENLGHELSAVAEDLRIRLVYLESIEAGRLSDLPGSAYVSGFLRAYSDYLGLDGEEIVRRFKMAGVEISGKTSLHLPSPVEEGRLPTAFILLVAAVIAGAAYGGWYFLTNDGRSPIEEVAKLPKELSGLVEDAKNQTAPVAAPAQASEQPSSPETDVPPAEAAEGVTSAAPSAPSEADNAADAASETAVQNATEQTQQVAETAEAAATDAAPQAETAAQTAETETPAAAQPATTVAESAESAVQETSSAATETATAVAETAREEPSGTPETASQTAPVSQTASVSQTESQPSETPAPAPEEPAAQPAAAPQPETPPQTASVPPPAAEPPPQPASRIDQPQSGSVRIVVRATADSYVAVLTADNEPLFSQLMRPGDSYEVPSGADLVLETGNAGGLQISVGGKRAPSLGDKGEILKNIPLDAEKLLSGSFR